MPKIERTTDKLYDMKVGQKPLSFKTKSPRSIRNMASRLGRQFGRIYTCKEVDGGSIQVWRLR